MSQACLIDRNWFASEFVEGIDAERSLAAHARARADSPPNPEDLPDRSRWAHLKAIGNATSNTHRDGKDCNEVRYYILSKYVAARRFAAAVRGHWSIENRLHWQLDVTFQEDQCRIRQGHADANFSILRRTAHSLLKNERTLKVGIKNKRLTSGWDESYLEKVLLGE
jgi:predicted transposase YbfD/YdcC